MSAGDTSAAAFVCHCMLPGKAAIVETFDALRAETQRLESIYHQKLAALDALYKRRNVRDALACVSEVLRGLGSITRAIGEFAEVQVTHRIARMLRQRGSSE